MKINPCKLCGNKYHSAFQCPQKAKAPLKVQKRINQRGKQYREWVKTRTTWQLKHKAEYYTCHYCGKRLHKTELTLDHMLSRSRHPELRHDLDNLIPCCWNCNTLKGSLNHDEYVHNCIIAV